MAKSQKARSDESRSEPTGAETMRVELARVRARFGLDPAIPSLLCVEPWTSPSGAVEEDEAEFVDALADCLSVGMSLGGAVASWASGALARGEEDEPGPEEDGERSALTASVRAGPARAHPNAPRVGPA